MPEHSPESPSLADRHVAITGGGRGIGAAIAAHLDRLGARVSLMGRNAEVLATQAARLQRAACVPVDVTDEASVGGAFAEAVRCQGPIDILVNNAGAARSAPLLRTDTALWTDMLAVNLTGVFLCTRAALEGMKERGWGRVISIASTAGLKGYAYVSAYCAAKHGVIGLTRALALETARTGVTVNAVCPGYTDTELLQAAIENIAARTHCSPDEAARQLEEVNPQHRFVDPAEVAATVAWLCLPGSDAITGQAIAVAGGEVM